MGGCNPKSHDHHSDMPDAFGNPIPADRQARQRRRRIRTVVALLGATLTTWGVLHWTELDGLLTGLAVFVVAFLILRLILSISGDILFLIFSFAKGFYQP
jgi:hypothetical protein